MPKVKKCMLRTFVVNGSSIKINLKILPFWESKPYELAVSEKYMCLKIILTGHGSNI